jgi:hypothetical protein
MVQLTTIVLGIVVVAVVVILWVTMGAAWAISTGVLAAGMVGWATYALIENDKQVMYAEAKAIVNLTKVNEFDHNLPQQEKVLQKCHLFTKKYFDKSISDLYPVDTSAVADSYAASIECSNLSKVKLRPLSEAEEQAHDGCLKSLEARDPAAYGRHLKRLMKHKDWDKSDAIADCKAAV